MKLVQRLARTLEPRRRRVAYTCMFGYSEKFADRLFDHDDSTDFICFTDDKSLRSNRWTFRYIDSQPLGPVRTSKKVKILAHQFLRSYSSSLYLDNTVKPKVPVQTLFSLLDASAQPMACFRHPQRSCIYDEAVVVSDLRMDSLDTISNQMSHYRSLGHPANAGLICGTVLLRRHNDANVIAQMERWFAEILRWSYRDQLSFNFVARQLGFVPSDLPGQIDNNTLLDWPDEPGPRLPRAFNDELYLQINPDVKAAGMNPRKHFIEFGAYEGRRYE